MTLDARLSALAEQARQDDDLRPLYRVVDRLIARGAAEDVAFLLREYRDLRWPDVREWVYGHLLDYLPAAPRPEMAETLLRHLIFDAPTSSRRRRGADMLGSCQPHEVVERWLGQYLPVSQGLSTLARLAQTLVLQGWKGAQTPLGERLHQALRQAGHPLGELPLSLHDWERNLPRRHYNYRLGRLGGESYASPSGALQGQPIPTPGRATPTPPPHTSLANSSGLTAPFDLWLEESNAQLEAKTVEFAAPVASPTPHLLSGLGLSSVGAPEVLQFQPCTAAEVFPQLFLGGLAGGAYGGALYGAEARLAAWRSLGALVGLPFAGNLEAIAALGQRCQFAFYFDPGGSFFDNVFDFAVACLRPDGRSLAVLAVTDTD